MVKNNPFIQPISKNTINSRTGTIISSFPVENIDISWMTKAQKKFFELLQKPINRDKKYDELCILAGYKSTGPWYTAIKEKRFIELLENIGISVRQYNDDYPAHHEVEYITNSKERENYMNQDVWDMRKFFKNFPKHRSPRDYIVKFTKIENKYFQNIIKKYYRNMLGNWQPATFSFYMKLICKFLNQLNNEFPNLHSFKDISREHIEKVLPSIYALSNKQAIETIRAVRSMFHYMYLNKWSDGPQANSLLIGYDTPKKVETLPRPIPPHIKMNLDDYLENKIIPLLENDEDTPILSPIYWDLLLILRYTGRRFEDIAHLISDGSDIDCLKYDLDGDPQLYLDHRIAKIATDLVIPLAHLKDSEGRNIVERAILRQKNRIKDLPPTKSDNQKYLFREIIGYDKLNKPITDAVKYTYINQNALPKICNQIPLINIGAESGDIYKITTHQFRHTVATEMIDAGVDIYAVKNFLGHSSVVMTEKYIKVYQQRLKKEFKDKLLKSDATTIKNNLPEQEEIFGDNKWVKNKIIAIFDQGDGCCEHPYKMPSCPHQVACKTCIKKKILPRHKNAVTDTIESFTTHLNQAKQIGLNEKIEEFDKVVRFYQTALKIIEKGETFDASKHFYTGGIH